MKLELSKLIHPKFHFWLLAAFLLMQAPLFSQTPYFRQVRLPDDIGTLSSIYQDTQGTIWLGTGSGLYRYSGKEFQLVSAPKGTEPQQISAIYMDSKGLLWVGTKKGGIFNFRNDTLMPLTLEEGLPSKAITGFASDKKGNLWFSTYGEGLYYFNEHHLYNLNADDGLSDNYCYHIVSDAYGRVWAATDEGVSICYASGRMKKVDKITSQQGLPDNIVLSIAHGRNGQMWIGMQDGGLCSINTTNFKISIPSGMAAWGHGPVKDILVFNDILWITSDKEGILEIDPRGKTPPIGYASVENMNFPKVNNLLSDDQGNCWFITNNELFFTTGPGLKIMNFPAGQIAGKVQGILADRYGKIWFSNENFLYWITPNRGLAKPVKVNLPMMSHTHIISLYEDSCGFIWAGTFGNGLLRVNPKTGHVRLINEKDGLTNGNILSITGRGDQIWLATLGGAYHCSMSGNINSDNVSLHFENFNQQNGPGNNYIYSVYIDCKMRVWFGTDGKGISVYDQGRFTTYDEKNGLKSKVVYSITEDEQGRIWFTTSNAGVYCFDGKTFRNYTEADGLSDRQISCIASDRHYHILFANDHGIDIMDTRTGSFIYYGSELGLENISPDLNVISGNGSNTFWLGTQYGMIRLEIPQDGQPRRPSLQLNKVAVFLSGQNFKDQHSFGWNQNYMTFFFDGAWYSAPDLVTYQIRLEGYDLGWINTKDNVASYSSLEPGTYTFKVRAALKNNFKDSVMVTYTFTIRKPFWQTFWFIISAALIILAGILLVIRQREMRFKQKETLEREKLLFQFQTLRSQVNPHFLFNSFSTLMSVIDENKDLAIEYVAKLSQFFRNILEYRDKDLIPLEEELKLIETYRYLQQQRYGKNFSLDINVGPEHRVTLIPPLTLQMLVENAIKHNVVSEDKPLEVKMYIEDNHLVVSNNLQRKKMVESSTGIGLMNIQNRYTLSGMVNVTVQETETEFMVRLPLINP